MNIRVKYRQCLIGFSVFTLSFANSLWAQTPSAGEATAPQTIAIITAPDTNEIADAEQLIEAVNNGDTQTAVQILRKYGVDDSTLQSISTGLNTLPVQVELKESFLKASVGAFALTDHSLRANVLTNLSDVIAARGYDRPVWIPRAPKTAAISNYDAVLQKCPQPPILVLDEKLDDSCFIRFFKFYNRYANQIHSVVLNGLDLSNAHLHSADRPEAMRQLNALYRLIKASKPDAFIWISVVKEDNLSDESWLEALPFLPDGLQILNLSQFHSPFAETRQRYQAILNGDLPMMVDGFLGYSAAIKQAGTNFAGAIRKGDQQSLAASTMRLGGIGAAGPDLAQIESYLQALGYRGISVSWLLLTALANVTNASAIDTSILPDRRISLLDIYYSEKNYTNMLSLAASLISNAKPGDVNWISGKLYQGIGLLTESPPDLTDAVQSLDDIINFKFKDRTGRNHYILGGVKWRIYAAALMEDTNKIQQLKQWVQTQPFPTNDLTALLNQVNHSTTNLPDSN